MEAVHDAKRLAELQELPLSRKVQITQARIIEWYQHYKGNVCVSFSGGKDSTALLHIVRGIYPDVKAVFSNTGLEYPEIQRFVKSFDNVDVVTPKMRFDQVISTYGYPVISKEVAQDIYEARRGGTYQRRKFNEKSSYCQRYGARYCLTKWLPLVRLPIGITHLCCNKTKKAPIKRYLRNTGYKQIVGTLAEESSLRRNSWIQHGCNAFDSKIQTSQPLSFWTGQDILAYIVKYGVEICSVYGEIVDEIDGCWYDPKESLIPTNGRLRCTGCDRTGQINAAA